MYDSIPHWIARWSVASALTGVFATLLLVILPADANTDQRPLVGQARVIDGDTIEISGRHVRLEGIDAPEMVQTCSDRAGNAWPCGRTAAKALEHLVAGGSLTCNDQGTDKYGRMLGVCFSGTRDVNAEMVRQGLAWAFVKYSRSYVREEAEARALHIGIWQGEAKPAWDFRAERWAGAEDAAPRGCAIKGNVSANGRIYHLPWSTWYGKVRIDEKKGERWFCSEAEALAAGWRPAVIH
jgi:endonuclease YncB( thermonuclease family)